MNRLNYLQFYTETYFNTFDECFNSMDLLDYSFKFRKNQFVKQIERKQKAVENDCGISLSDFIDESNFALNILAGQIATNVQEHYKNNTVNYDEIIYVPLEKVNSKLTGLLCANDLELIMICFNSFASLSPQIEPQHHTPELNSDTTPTKVKDYKNTLWFTTGIKLATGEAFDLHKKYKGTKGCFERICEDLEIDKGRPYISTTINDKKPKEVFSISGKKMPMIISDKNTFANKDKLQKLHKHLTENNLPFGAEFLEKYNQIEPE